MATHEADVRRAAELIRSSKNVIVLTGAGLSTGLGIPDFRSHDGIYARIAEGASQKRRRFKEPTQEIRGDTSCTRTRRDHASETKYTTADENEQAQSTRISLEASSGTSPSVRPDTLAIPSRNRRAAAHAGETKRRHLSTSLSEAEATADAWDHKKVMDIISFREDPSRFYEFAWLLFAAVAEGEGGPGPSPGPVHRWIRSLELKGKLLRNYTQNIDGLEARAGIGLGQDHELSPSTASDGKPLAQPSLLMTAAASAGTAAVGKVIFCHGSFATATCLSCGWQVDGRLIEPQIRRRQVPRCEQCVGVVAEGGDVKGKKRSSRSSSSSKRDKPGTAATEMRGVMKPDITFFNESVPDVFDRAWTTDKERCDLLIVIGTSLKVSPVNKIPKQLAATPQILINREPVGTRMKPTVFLQGECDDVIRQLIEVEAELSE